MIGLFSALAIQTTRPRLESNGLWGYINASATAPPEKFGYGVSLYSAAWPLMDQPVQGFQLGLASTWILPDNRTIKTPLLPHGTVARDSMPERGPSFWTVFQTIEGGLGFWASNKYAAGTAKFRMNGTIDGYNHELSTPGWEFSGKPLPAEYMGIAQLSNHILVPPDGVTLDKDTCGQLFGYAWMALPLIPAKSKPVATGDQCWTAFFNTKNFRGPVAFYLPSAWSKISQIYPPAIGRGLDALPGLADSGAIEINTVPQFVSGDEKGSSYAKIPQLQFPADKNGQTVLMHNLTVYSKAALSDEVERWKAGGTIPSGAFNVAGAHLQEVKANPLQVKQGGKEWAKGVERWVSTTNLDSHTFGLQWQPVALSAWKRGFQKGRFPQFYKRDGSAVEAISSDQVPPASGLAQAEFDKPDVTQSYLPSDGGMGVWKNPGPAAGPFKAVLADKSVVTYYWYKFVDQPTMQAAGLTVSEKQKLQGLVEQMHRHWTSDKEYMANPGRGTLASLDAGQLVTPPRGLEVGYVPVAYRQDPLGR